MLKKNLPNILWFCADQMRFDVINALGNKHINTPKINALINDGVAFRNCYVQNQLCTPSRASFLTGRYPAAHQVYRNGNAFFPKSEVLVTKLLADAGYDCGLVGKLHLSSASKLEKDLMMVIVFLNGVKTHHGKKFQILTVIGNG